MTTVKALLQQSAAKLSAVSESPHLDAEILLAHVLQLSRLRLRVEADLVVTPAQEAQFMQFIQRRLTHEPIAYLIGHKEFWSLELAVNQHTLVPRPETELLIETALQLFPQDSVIKVVDLGTGSGAIAIALASERPHWHIDAVDISQNALTLASKNAQRLGFAHISFYHGNWFTALPSGKYDLVLSNPPYLTEEEWPAYSVSLAAEPKSALVSGQDGLDDIRAIAANAKTRLQQGGYLLMEHGEAQGALVRKILLENCYQQIRTLLDLSGKERVTMGQNILK